MGDRDAGGNALLLHNEECSKSQALRAALDAQDIPYVERRYLEDPLTLSELETVLARLQAGAAERGAFSLGDICRDADMMTRIRMANMFRSSFFHPEGGSPRDENRDALLEQLALEPELLQRPVLLFGQKAALGRP